MRNIFKHKNKHGAFILGVFSLIFIAVAFVCSFGDVSAEEQRSSLTLSPMSQRIILVPGETYTGSIKVINSVASTVPMNYTAKVGSYNPTRNDGRDDYEGGDTSTRSNYNMMMDWTTIDKPTGVLQPNEVAVVTFSIKVPKDAPAGAQYISIIASNENSNESANKNGANIDSKFQIGSIIYANVAGETIEKGAISENSMPSVITSNKLEAVSMVKNEGNVYTDASYMLQVWPMFSDEEICTNEEKTESSLILPNTERYHVQTCELPTVGIFRAKQVVKIFGEESTLEKVIIVCPIWLMLLIVVIIIAIIVAIVILIKRGKEKKAAKKSSGE